MILMDTWKSHNAYHTLNSVNPYKVSDAGIGVAMNLGSALISLIGLTTPQASPRYTTRTRPVAGSYLGLRDIATGKRVSKMSSRPEALILHQADSIGLETYLPRIVLRKHPLMVPNHPSYWMVVKAWRAFPQLHHPKL